MLVLFRKPGQRILIGDDTTITVIRIAGGGVRLGIDAPDGVPIAREELGPPTVSPIDERPKPCPGRSPRPV